MAKKKKNDHSFKKGYGLLPNKDMKKARQEIMNILGISSRSQWYERLWGNVVPNVDEKTAIEQVFSKYKVKQSEIWGS